MKTILVLTFISLLSLSTFTAFADHIPEADERIRQLDVAIADLEKNTENLQHEIDIVRINQEGYKDYMLNLQTKIHNLQYPIYNLEIQTAIQNWGISGLDNEISNRQNQIANLYDRTSNLKSQLYSFEADYVIFKQWVTDFYYTFLFPGSG